ncbi:hypothetical protein [Brucella intermedia]|uniref:hypothetical protein n=1 Tax=Brucella intermedia TaxID=94625 RepID=UPI00224B8845|nr:hypothetical protein [Brucella intermedia]
MGVSKGNWRTARKKFAPKTQEAVGLRFGFRSGLEEMNAKHLERLGVEVSFESFKIPYTVPETKRTYTPDFPLPNGIIVETKGKLEPKDRAKHLLIKLQHPELDIRFVFQRPFDKIVKGSKTTYAAWAEKHGFKWATKVIPEAWVREAGPKVKPEVILTLKK